MNFDFREREEAFRAVDYQANLAVAQAARAAGCKRLGVVSAMGADAGSRIFYNRVKGELEEAVKRIQFDGIHIFRPSFLIGRRAESRTRRPTPLKISDGRTL